jgi:Lower baseplate protein N-terminal domain
MRKILLLLLLITAPYLGFSQTLLDEGIQLGGNTKTTTANKVLMQEDSGLLNYKDREVFTENSAGAISGFAITNNGNGTVNLASGYAMLRATASETGVLQKHLIPAVTNLALTDNVNNYVIVQYNGGSPNIVAITDPSLITTTNNTLIYVIARYGTTINYLYTGEQNVDSNGKLRRRFLNIEPITRASGAAIGFTNRSISTTAGLFYGGLTPYTTPLLGATFTNAYNNGSVWTRQTAQTQVNNTQYNLNGVLTSMTNGRFRTDFVYIMVNNPSVLYTVMGTSQTNTLADARLVTMPSTLPVELQRLGVLVGRLIIGTNNVAITEVSSAYEITFNASTVINHNDTGNIQGGAVGDYQHVTTAEKTIWNDKQNTIAGTANYLTKFGSGGVVQSSASVDAQGNLRVDGGSGDDTFNLYKSTGASIGIRGATGGGKVVINSSNSVSPDMGFFTNNLQRCTILFNGNTLFGTTTDNGSLLQVNGNITANAATLSNQVVVLSQLAGYAPLASPALTGTPTAPTATAGTNTTQVATTAFVLANTNANAVLLTGNQTIMGSKTFNNNINAPSIDINLSASLANTGVKVTNANGSAFTAINTSTGAGFVANGNATGTGLNYLGQNNGTNTFTVDKLGNVTANSFIKSGGTANQMLMANGSTRDYSTLPAYADNAAAIAGGLAVGALYRTLIGLLAVVY